MLLQIELLAFYIEAAVQVPAVPFPNQFPASESLTIVNDGPSTWTLTSHMEELDTVLRS